MARRRRKKVSVIRGDTPTFKFRINQRTLAGAVSPFPLVGNLDITFTIKDEFDDPDSEAIVLRACNILGDPEDGVCYVKLTETDTALEPETYLAEVELNFDNGLNVITPIQFDLVIDPDVYHRR